MATQLDDADRRIVERIAPWLARDGLFFVGIDVIGGLLTEVNVTSPTGVQEINALEGRSLEAEIVDALEARVAAHRREPRVGPASPTEPTAPPTDAFGRSRNSDGKYLKSR